MAAISNDLVWQMTRMSNSCSAYDAYYVAIRFHKSNPSPANTKEFNQATRMHFWSSAVAVAVRSSLAIL